MKNEIKQILTDHYEWLNSSECIVSSDTDWMIDEYIKHLEKQPEQPSTGQLIEFKAKIFIKVFQDEYKHIELSNDLDIYAELYHKEKLKECK